MLFTKTKEFNKRQSKQLKELLCFEFEIKYVKGSLKERINALS